MYCVKCMYIHRLSTTLGPGSFHAPSCFPITCLCEQFISSLVAHPLSIISSLQAPAATYCCAATPEPPSPQAPNWTSLPRAASEQPTAIKESQFSVLCSLWSLEVILSCPHMGDNDKQDWAAFSLCPQLPTMMDSLPSTPPLFLLLPSRPVLCHSMKNSQFCSPWTLYNYPKF